jgi:hypothetical protein
MIFGAYILNILYFVFAYSKLPFLSLLFLLSIPAMFFYGARITLQRYHDLDMSGWYVFFLSFVTKVSAIVPFFLFFKKGDYGINEYDEAINYQKLFNNKICIDIYDNIFTVNNEEYQYERYLGKYKIKISNYGKENFLTEYLLKKYPSNEERIHRTFGITHKAIEISEEEFGNLIKQMNFIVVKNSFFVKLKEVEIFIRKEDFKYTIILDKNVFKETLDILNFPGLFSEDEKSIYYKKINKNDLLMWAKNVA